VDMPIAVLRHGLVGGGMEDDEARRLVDRMVDLHPIGKFVTPAYQVIAAAVVGVEYDPVGEPEGETISPKNGASAPSTRRARKSASPHAK